MVELVKFRTGYLENCRNQDDGDQVLVYHDVVARKLRARTVYFFHGRLGLLCKLLHYDPSPLTNDEKHAQTGDEDTGQFIQAHALRSQSPLLEVLLELHPVCTIQCECYHEFHLCTFDTS
jgi:hypothetical protein